MGRNASAKQGRSRSSFRTNTNRKTSAHPAPPRSAHDGRARQVVHHLSINTHSLPLDCDTRRARQVVPLPTHHHVRQLPRRRRRRHQLPPPEQLPIGRVTPRAAGQWRAPQRRLALAALRPGEERAARHWLQRRRHDPLALDDGQRPRRATRGAAPLAARHGLAVARAGRAARRMVGAGRRVHSQAVLHRLRGPDALDATGGRRGLQEPRRQRRRWRRSSLTSSARSR